jgi:hypothetical protein
MRHWRTVLAHTIEMFAAHTHKALPRRRDGRLLGSLPATVMNCAP